MRYTKEQRIRIIIISIITIYPMCRFWFGLPIWLSAALSVVMLVVLILSFHFEKTSNEKFAQIKDKIENGGQPTADDDEMWKVRYEEFLEKDGFHTVKASSMKADLFRRYTRPSGYILALFGIVVAVASLIMFHGTDGADIVCALFGLGFVVYGAFGIYPRYIVNAVKGLGDKYDEINDSYMNGRLLTFKKTINHDYINDGINIGERYVIMFTRKQAAVMNRNRIVNVTNSLRRTKIYGDGLYTGTSYSSHLCITMDDGKSFSIQLSDVQAQLACDTLSRYDVTADSASSEGKKEFHY